MRVAYTINGLIGGFVGRNSQTSDKSNDSVIILEYVSNLLYKNIIQPNNADVFIFSWHTNFENQFKENLNPKRMKLEKQIDFTIPDHLKSGNTDRVKGHMSRWYGVKEVINLVWEYENENNFEYDLVVNARFDICWNRKYDLFNLNPNNFHIPIHWDKPHWGWPLQNPEISDHIFATNSNWMKHYATLYDKIDEYTLPGQCPQWNTISNHFLMVWHLRKLGLLSEDIVKKTFKVLHHSSKDIVGGSKDPNIDYDLFRFRKFTKDEVIKLNDKTNNI